MKSVREYWFALQQLNHDVRIYLLTAVLAGFATSGVYSVLLNLYLLRLGYDAAFIGIVNAAGQAAFIFMSIPAGTLGERWGTRRLIIAGISSYFLGFLCLPLAEFVPQGWQSGWLVGASLLASFGGPLYWTNGNLYLMDRTSPIERNHAFSLRTAFFPLAGFIGSLVGGFLPSRFAGWLNVTLDSPAPYRYSLLFASLLFIPAIWAMWRTEEIAPVAKRAGESTVSQEGIWRTIPYALFVPLAMIMFLRTAGESAARYFFNVYLDTIFGVPTSQIGTILAITLFLTVPAALITPAFAGKWGNDRVFFVGMVGMSLCMVGMSLCMVPLALFQQPAIAAISYIFLMIFAAVTKPTLYVYRLEIVTAVWWAAMSGVGGTAHGLGQAISAFSGGYLITAVGFRTFYLLAAILTFAGAIGFWFFARTQRQHGVHAVTPTGD
ncbi:MAG: MFS transporter [Chloroflexota bacterium]